MEGVDLGSGLSSYTINVQILSPKEDGKIIENVEINVNKPLGDFLSNLKLGSVCLLELTQKKNKYHCDHAIWYMKDDKFYSFEDNQEIPRDNISEECRRVASDHAH